MLTAEPELEPLAPLTRPSHGLVHAGRRALSLVDGEAAGVALGAFVATRLAFIAISLAAPLLFADHATRQAPTGSGWVRWDAQWFIATAEHGYPWKLFGDRDYSTIAFFPLYPLAIRLLMLSGLHVDLAALIVPNLAFLPACYYLYRLVRLDFPAEVAARTTWLLALFPTALAFFIPYTESLYLLCSVLMFWHLRQRRWLLAGLAGALGALTRQSGIVLALPFLVEWYAARREGRGSWRALAPMLLMPLAVAAHLTYLWRVTGSPTAFLGVQRAWHRTLEWPWAGVVATIQRWGLPDVAGHETGHQAHIVMELGALGLFMLLLVVGLRRVRASYSAYSAAVWLAALISPAIADNYWLPIMSSSRFALSVFPGFMVLALALRRPAVYQAWLAASAMLLGLLAVYFFLGGWVA
jgi:hypothetical protein